MLRVASVSFLRVASVSFLRVASVSFLRVASVSFLRVASASFLRVASASFLRVSLGHTAGKQPKQQNNRPPRNSKIQPFPHHSRIPTINKSVVSPLPKHVRTGGCDLKVQCVTHRTTDESQRCGSMSPSG